MIRRVLFLMLAAAPFVTAQKEDAAHPIDVRLNACMAANPSTNGERQCIGAAEREWDTELNREYKKLQSTLGPEAKASLTKAQLAWIAYRDAEFGLIARIYDVREGSMFGPMQAYVRLKVVRARARELAEYAARRERV